MKFKILVPVAIVAAGLMGVSGEAQAKDGNRKSALIGAAAGVAVGAVGATLYHRSQQPSAPARPEYTGSTARPVSYQAAGGCSVRPVRLFDEQGNYVKTERLKVCR
ncbi:MAG TPA: hypothetical protein PK812_02815 [Beijerinckiaceae bacterium]|nr:hypothetical protein [Beijerinckiaceae bacterium]